MTVAEVLTRTWAHRLHMLPALVRQPKPAASVVVMLEQREMMRRMLQGRGGE